MLSLKNISKKYKDQQVLKELNIDIGDKEFISIMGKSGVGKTTLLSIMAGLVAPDDGKIIFKDANITNYSEEKWANFRLKNLGIVFQDFKLIPSLSVFDNIYLAIYPRTDLGKVEKKKRVMEIARQVELEKKINEPIDNLSGGEKQRVAIARSLVNQPKLVLADEPTGNLDQATSEKIMELFQKLHSNLSTTFMVITHEKDITRKTQKCYQLTEQGLSIISLT